MKRDFMGPEPNARADQVRFQGFNDLDAMRVIHSEMRCAL
jgi:hypothetical protein